LQKQAETTIPPYKQTVATEALVRGLLPRIAPNAPPSIPPANVPPAEATGKGKS